MEILTNLPLKKLKKQYPNDLFEYNNMKIKTNGKEPLVEYVEVTRRPTKIENKDIKSSIIDYIKNTYPVIAILDVKQIENILLLDIVVSTKANHKVQLKKLLAKYDKTGFDVYEVVP